MPDDAQNRILPAHIETTVEAIARLHAEHFERASALQKLVERLTSRAGRPTFVAWLTIAVMAWISLNLGLILTGHKAPD